MPNGIEMRHTNTCLVEERLVTQNIENEIKCKWRLAGNKVERLIPLYPVTQKRSLLLELTIVNNDDYYVNKNGSIKQMYIFNCLVFNEMNESLPHIRRLRRQSTL